MIKAGLKPKQRKFVAAFRSQKYKYLCAAGATGSGKSLVTLGLLHLLCYSIPNLKFAVIRKSEKNLKQTTIPSYNQMKKASRSVGFSYISDMKAIYPKTGSEILFIWADVSKDPDLDNIKGLELTGALIEEANQIDKRYFELLKTRIGRWNNEDILPFIMLNLNPALGWVKDLFYDNWRNNTLPEGHYFEEFNVEDNDSLSPEFVKGLEDLPEAEYRRFVKNNWDYSDVPNQLIKFEWYKQCAGEGLYVPQAVERRLGAIDPAWEGDDATVFGFMHGSHIGWWESYAKQDPDFSGTLGFERAKEHHIEEGDLIVDPVGLGAATVLQLRNKHNFEPYLHYGGADPYDTFGLLAMFNTRSEAHWLYREALRTEEITIDHHPDLQRQTLALKYSIDEKKIRIRPKHEIKKDIHESPGYVDVATMLIHRWKTSEGGLMQQLAERQTAGATVGILSRAERERAQAIKRERIGRD